MKRKFKTVKKGNRLAVAFYLFILSMGFIALSMSKTDAAENKSAETASVEPPTLVVKEQGSRIEELEQKIEELKQGDVVEKQSLIRRLFVTGIVISVIAASVLLI